MKLWKRYCFRLTNKAVFLDRDGTIIKHVPYLKNQSDLEILPEADSIHLLNDAGFKVVVITNQSGIGRGYFTQKDFCLLNEKMKNDLSKSGSRIDEIYHCPHVPDDNCSCRKPENGLIKEACAEMTLNPQLSFMIGDRKTDIEAGSISGCKTVLVLSGYGKVESKKIEQWVHKPDYVASDLSQAVHWICNA